MKKDKLYILENGLYSIHLDFDHILSKGLCFGDHYVTEIPLFHVLNARVTFGNILGSATPAEFVTLIREPTMVCAIEDECFEAPPSYRRSGK